MYLQSGNKYIFLYDHTNIYISSYLDDKTCHDLIIYQDFYYTFISILVVELMSLSNLHFDKKLMNSIRNIIITLFGVEYLAYNVTFINFWYKIDVLTVYLFVWQLTSLGSKWLKLELLPPIFIIEQSSFCIMAALFTCMIEFILFHYLLRELILVGLWLLSLYDM